MRQYAEQHDRILSYLLSSHAPKKSSAYVHVPAPLSSPSHSCACFAVQTTPLYLFAGSHQQCALCGHTQHPECGSLAAFFSLLLPWPCTSQPHLHSSKPPDNSQLAAGLDSSRSPGHVQAPISSVRFVAVSATIANIQDVAAWLQAPTVGVLTFGEELRPVKLTTIVKGYAPTKTDFLFERRLNDHLLPVIQAYSTHKPTLVFCRCVSWT